MELKKVEELLERYWNCNTTAEEEQALRAFFSSEKVPDSLSMYKSWFLWQSGQSQINISPDFSERILDKLDKDSGKKPLKTGNYFYLGLKIAASVLIVLSIGLGIQTHIQEEKIIEQTYMETYTDPEAAMEEARAALDKVSSSLSKGSSVVMETLMVPDSVQPLKNNNEKD